MTLLCFASQKGSPGVSAAALAVAATLQPGSDRRKLLLEADLSGGVLAVRYRLPPEPGLVTLAAAARAGLEPDELWRHVVELPGGLPAVVGAEGPDQVHSALAAAGAELGRHLAERRDLDVICDLGRLVPGSPALDLASQATAVLMVARPTAEQLQPAARRLLALRPQIRNLGWLLVGDKPHGPAEVEETFGFPVVGVLADDRRTIESIEAGAVTRRVRRQPFVRSAATVADTLRGWLAPLAEAPRTDGDGDDVGSAGTPPTPALAIEDAPEPTASGPAPAPRAAPTAAPAPRTAPTAPSDPPRRPHPAGRPAPAAPPAPDGHPGPITPVDQPRPADSVVLTGHRPSIAPVPEAPSPPSDPEQPRTPFVHDDDDITRSA